VWTELQFSPKEVEGEGKAETEKLETEKRRMGEEEENCEFLILNFGLS
jgi:hypothetical protein